MLLSISLMYILIERLFYYKINTFKFSFIILDFFYINKSNINKYEAHMKSKNKNK